MGIDWQSAWPNSFANPHLFATGVLGYLPYGAENPDGADQLEAWQDDFLRNFFKDPDNKTTNSPRHSVRSGHGVGKSTVIAILALWFPLTHFDSKTVVTANSQDQLRDNNWPEIRKQAGKLPEPLRAQLQIDNERLFVKANPELAFVVRRTASVNNPEALQGIHAKHVLYLVDEASGIPDIVYEVAQGSLSTHGAIACLFSNPTRTNGFFFDTHNRLRTRWRTMQVSSEDVPRARGHIDDIVATYGRHSNKYNVRVLGQFPTADDDTVIALSLIEAATRREVEQRDVMPIWGVDVARFGDDRSVLVKRKGNVVAEAPKVWRQKDNMQLVGLIVAEWNKVADTDDRPAYICVDVIGTGSGVVDRLNELGLPVHAVNVAESAASDDEYHRLRDELWFKAKEWFASLNVSLFNDQTLTSELAAPTYDFRSDGAKVVESKKDTKKRLLTSPDLADAFINTFAMPDTRKIVRRPPRTMEQASPWAA